MENQLGYPDLEDPDYVYEALLGYGMFSSMLPPCFSSQFLFKIVGTRQKKNKPHVCITYMASRNTGVSRQLAIPHPESHMALCALIKKRWQSINKHIGKPEPKFNFCHVRKITDKQHIFEMNYVGTDKWRKEDLEQEYSIGCSHVVKSDISTCFPSIYSHSIPWAIQGKDDAKRNRKITSKLDGHWSNDIDVAVRNCNDAQTNGLLIGPHTSNIIAEIILTKIDCDLQEKGFKRIFRYIDDYTYFASSEAKARQFIKQLELCLKQYELLPNQKKTSICTLIEYYSDEWPQKLARFNFPEKEEIGFTSVDTYLNYAISLTRDSNDFAIVKYAIKVISNKNLSDRAKKLYVKKLLAMSLLHPYLIPLLEEKVFCFDSDVGETLKGFLPLLFKKSIEAGTTDSLAFCFYYALQYGIPISSLPEEWAEQVIELEDCISTLLAWEYSEAFGTGKTEEFDKRIKEIKKTNRKIDQFWLFIYEHASTEEDIPSTQNFLKKLKENRVTFFEFNQSQTPPTTLAKIVPEPSFHATKKDRHTK